MASVVVLLTYSVSLISHTVYAQLSSRVLLPCKYKSTTEWFSNVIPPDYDKRDFPPQYDNHSSVYFPVFIDVHIVTIFDVNQIDSSVKLLVALIQTWVDTRLAQGCVFKNQSRHSLLASDREKIWTPQLSFDATESRRAPAPYPVQYTSITTGTTVKIRV